MDYLTLAKFAYVAVILVISCAASLFFYHIPESASRQQRIVSHYFMGFFTCFAAGYALYVLRIFIEVPGVVAVTNFLLIFSFHSIRYAFYWRRGRQVHVHENLWILAHILGFTFIQGFCFRVLIDSAELRITFATVNFILLQLYCQSAVAREPGTLTHGELSAKIGLYLSAALLGAALLVYLISGNIFYFQTALMLTQAAGLVILLGSFQSLLLSDITELHYQNSITDAMTGLHNRRYFMSQAATALHSAQRYEFPIAVLMCDIDKFKNINDQHGHDIGDLAIIAFANALKSLVRDSDIIARFGGEEFIVMLPQTTLEGALSLAERMRSKTEQLCIASPRGDISFTASFGITACSASTDIEQYIRAADGALYEAKENGRNQVQATPTQSSDDSPADPLSKPQPLAAPTG